MMKADKLFFMALVALSIYGLSGCASPRPMAPRETPAPVQEKTQESRQPETAVESKPTPPAPAPAPAKPVVPAPKQQSQPSARQLASLRLTEAGKEQLDQGNADQAIALFERAVSMHAANGQNYFYLAECWLLKSNPAQAKEYNRLATLYFQGNQQWLNKCADQAELIRKMER